MAKKSLNLTGTSGQTYNLDGIAAETRINSVKKLVVQVHEYNPDSVDEAKRAPNPSNLVVGQIWLSKRNTGL
jgi:hypothetical protein